MKLKIALIDDHKMFAETLAGALGQQEFVQSVSIYYSALAFLEQNSDADIIVSDIMMPGMTGLELLTQLHKHKPEIKFVFLSSIVEGQTIRNAMRNGASGYLGKGAPLNELAEAIQAVYNGEQYIGRELRDGLIKSTLSEEVMNYELSPQQKEVLKQICHGRTIKEIAFDMKLSVNTVQTYYKNIMKKFNVNRTVDLILLAVQRGLVAAPTNQ